MSSVMPGGDIWRLKDSNPDSQNYGTVYKFDFSYIRISNLKHVLKEYIWMNYMTGNRTVRSLREFTLKIKYFNSFCTQSGLIMLSELDNQTVENYRLSLKSHISNLTGKPLSYSYQKACFDALKSLVNWARIHMPGNVPETEIFTGNEYRGVHQRLKIDFIPDEILQKINKALKDENNPYVKYGITILESTGMRIGDLLLLTTACIKEHPISGYTISWFDHKNRKSRNGLPVPNTCRDAVWRLLETTAALRDRAAADLKERLFIYEPRIGTNRREIVPVSRQTFGKWCRDFSGKHHITDTDGNPYSITSRMFRRTLATDMLSKGTNVKVIQETLGHASVTTTKLYYADIKDAARVEMFEKIGILGNIDNVDEHIIPDSVERQWFKQNCTGKARLSDGYCTLPIQQGTICSRLLSRQKCYTCSRYITTLEDLDTHKRHLEELQALLDSNIYGEHYAAHLTPTVIVLKEIIKRLEALKNEH